MTEYTVRKVYITRNRYPGIYAVMDDFARKAKLLRNAALFRIRNNFTVRNKEHLTANEAEVRNEILNTHFKKHGPKAVISYTQLDRIMRDNNNPDYFSGLPMQSAEEVLKGACRDFKGWLSALKDYKVHPEKYLGKPKMPHYAKSDMYKVTFTNQDCALKPRADGHMRVKFPLTKETVGIGILAPDTRLKEVQCCPDNGGFMLLVILASETPDAVRTGCYTASIDLGVDNLASIVCNSGNIPCRIYKGGYLKSVNQWYNKQMAQLKSSMMTGHDPKTHHCPTTKRMQSLSRKRSFIIDDCFHKTAKDIISWCLSNDIGALVVGHTDGWKQNSDIGSRNNQSFVQLPFAKLIKMLMYLCERHGITLILQEESYTSKASACDRDDIPVYDKNSPYTGTFSGKRIRRGLYRTADGTKINADLNGAANIMRKAVPCCFEGTDIKKALQNVEVIRHGDLYKTHVTG